MDTQVVLNVSNPAIIPSLKKVLSAIDGVTIVSTPRKRKMTGFEEAMLDVEEGRVEEIKDLDSYFAAFGV